MDLTKSSVMLFTLLSSGTPRCAELALCFQIVAVQTMLFSGVLVLGSQLPSAAQSDHLKRSFRDRSSDYSHLLSSNLPFDHDPADTKHAGELFGVRGSDIHSLAWSIKLRDGCLLDDVVKRVNFNYVEEPHIPTSKLCSNIYSQLILVRKIPFDEVYVVAHPYYRFFERNIRNERKQFKRHILNKHLLGVNSYNNSSIKNAEQTVSDSNFQSSMSLDRRKDSSNEELGLRRSIHIPSTLRCPRSVMFSAVENCTETYLQKHPCVAWHQQEVLRKRRRRATLGQVPIKSSKASQSSGVDQILALNRSKRTKINFEDPLYEQQWHLHGGLGSNWTLPEEQSPLLHLNIRSAWESGVTGQGVTVCVIDDGLEWNHEDIRDNYNSQASYDLNADDPDPSPASNGENNEHGTRCAGEIAGVANSVCGVGVAYRASVSGLRVLGGRVTDSMEALAFSHQIQRNHVFSCSWGPEDDGATVDGPRTLGRRALRWGTTYGRKGRGAVYVVASGNGGDVSDNCNYDGYANSVFTVTIGAVNSRGQPPFYAEWCAAMLAVAPSSGLHGKDIVTTDWHGRSTSGCTLHHTGTSAAAPLAAGVVALALHTQPCLGWRDLQHLLALSSVQIDPTHQDWSTNAAGLHHSHHYGFGLLDASAMVSAAAVWETLPFSSKYVGPKLSPDEGSLDAGSANVSFTVLSDTLDRVGLRTLETVEVRVWLTHEYRGSVGYTLVCPSGTASTLAPPRLKDTSTAGLSGWPLVTVRCWAESPGGLYQLRVQQSPQLDRQMSGQLVQWQLVLYGSSALPSEVLRRHETARAAMRGETVVVGNRSHLCHPVPPLYPPTAPLPASWLKVLVMVGCMAAVAAVVTLLEYAFCYNAEKRRFRETLEQMALAHRTFRRRSSAARWQQHHLASSSSADGAHSVGLPLLAPPSPSPSCDADQSASPDECQSDDDDDDEGGGACTSTTYPRDTTDAPPSSSSCCSSDEAVAACRAGPV